MAVVADSRTAPSHERFEAFRAGLDAALPPTSSLVELTPDAHGALHAWHITPSATLLRLQLAAERARMVQKLSAASGGTAPEQTSVAVAVTGLAVTESLGTQEQGRTLRVLDTSTAFQNTFKGDSEVIAFEVDTARVGLTVDSVRRATGRAQESPLHDLVRRHLIGMVAPVEVMEPDAASILANATADLVRALVMSISPRAYDRRRAAAETLRARIEDYVRLHLGDADLTPARLAQVHHVSLRYLYQMLSSTGRTPAEWMMDLRLERARADLCASSVTVSSVAQRWGFRDHSHFTRRFKSAYGMTPTDFARSRAGTDTEAGDLDNRIG
jgi:AraC-like DNA-binding protein